MKFFGKKNKEVLQQDKKEVGQRPGMIFMIHLLMEEKCEMPAKETMEKIMNEHMGENDCFCYDGKVAGFGAKRYPVHFEKEDKDLPAQLMIMDCVDIKEPLMDNIAMSQMWDCPEGKDILEKCKYQVIATDMLAANLYYKDRADMLVNFIEALVEMYPSCKAVVFENSKKIFTREAILNCQVPREQRFIYYAVNARFFNIQGTEDSVVDSVGMSTLFLPDIQYHYHNLDPNDVINHAYNVLIYMFENDNPIKDGDHIDGLVDGRMSQDVQWNVQYEESLIQPVREVIDINPGVYAAGDRN